MPHSNTYTYLVGFKDGTTVSFFLKDASVADVLESALSYSGHDVAMGTFDGYVDPRFLHTEEDLEKYDFYVEYVDRFVNDSHSRCQMELLF